MRTYTANEYGRVVVMHLGKGEKVLESVQSEMDRLGIKNAVLLSGIGSLRKVSLHIIKNTDALAVNEFITVEKPIEIGAIQGIILDGVPHFHIVCSDPERTYVGHLEEGCEVQYLAELSLLEVKGIDLTRRKDEYGIDYIDVK